MRSSQNAIAAIAAAIGKVTSSFALPQCAVRNQGLNDHHINSLDLAMSAADRILEGAHQVQN